MNIALDIALDTCRKHEGLVTVLTVFFPIKSLLIQLFVYFFLVFGDLWVGGGGLFCVTSVY